MPPMTKEEFHTKTVKQHLLDAGLGLTEEDFDTHESDLYVRDRPGLHEWLKENYPFYSNVKAFKSNPECSWAGAFAWDIPFANDAFWDAKP